MEQLEAELATTKRKIDAHDDYAIPRLEKQLKAVEGNLSNLRNKREAMGSPLGLTGGAGNRAGAQIDSDPNSQNQPRLPVDPFASPLNQSQMNAFVSPDRLISRFPSGNNIINQSNAAITDQQMI